ncbi:hypothetical protein F9U64_20810 [Gracilibacillus oryzae]|uniref:Uncharacterized protein n=1 Tax=Gracilibacillus oryzae TaxID=1672701 RepID=A0A7C8KVR3_9BACI|nr:hypothetical protein [Gracilibacillus oryzae]KAB8126077.1 hypothetical protein F9U64_20810 [Gracilibacillus oryzae]
MEQVLASHLKKRVLEKKHKEAMKAKDTVKREYYRSELVKFYVQHGSRNFTASRSFLTSVFK